MLWIIALILMLAGVLVLAVGFIAEAHLSGRKQSSEDQEQEVKFRRVKLGMMK